MMTDDEIIAVVQAHKEGKKIEIAYAKGPTRWVDNNRLGLGWDFMQYKYRVAPEPRKPREWVVTLDTLTGNVDDYPSMIRVREVIE